MPCLTFFAGKKNCVIPVAGRLAMNSMSLLAIAGNFNGQPLPARNWRAVV
jgi:hypothetical protein